MKQHSFASPQQIDALLAVIIPVVDPFQRKWIAEGEYRPWKRDPMPASVQCCLLIIPFKHHILHGDY